MLYYAAIDLSDIWSSIYICIQFMQKHIQLRFIRTLSSSRLTLGAH